MLIRPAPVPGFRGTRSFALPEFDPFWKRVVELDILVALHSSDSGYDRYANGGGQRPGDAAVQADGVPHAVVVAPDRGRRRVARRATVPSSASRSSRSPSSRTAAVWVEPLQRAMKDTYKKMPQDFPEDPVAAMRRNVYISPFWEEDYGHLADLLGEDHVLFGSDYPHPEGLEHPAAYANDLEHHGPERVAEVHGRQPRQADERREHPRRPRPRHRLKPGSFWPRPQTN